MSDTPTTESAQPENNTPNWSLLAAKAFGSDYKGEVKQPETPAPEVAQELPTKAAPEPTENAPAEPAGEEEIRSFEQLAEKFELDPDWLQSLEITQKINGETRKVKLADLTKTNQTFEAAEQRLEQAKQMAKATTAELAQRREQLNAQYTIAAELISEAERLLDNDNKAIDWNKLREQDPAEWSAKKAEIAERQARINSMKQKAVNSYQSGQQKALEEAQQAQLAYLQEQRDLLHAALPEWKDEKIATQERQDITKFLLDSGFTKEDVGAASDHRMILLARKAMLFDKGQNKAEVIKKKVLTIPKVLKPGAPKSPEHASKERVEQIRSKLRNSGSIEDAFALLKAKRG